MPMPSKRLTGSIKWPLDARLLIHRKPTFNTSGPNVRSYRVSVAPSWHPCKSQNVNAGRLFRSAVLFPRDRLPTFGSALHRGPPTQSAAPPPLPVVTSPSVTIHRPPQPGHRFRPGPGRGGKSEARTGKLNLIQFTRLCGMIWRESISAPVAAHDTGLSCRIFLELYGEERASWMKTISAASP